MDGGITFFTAEQNQNRAGSAYASVAGKQGSKQVVILHLSCIKQAFHWFWDAPIYWMYMVAVRCRLFVRGYGLKYCVSTCFISIFCVWLITLFFKCSPCSASVWKVIVRNWPPCTDSQKQWDHMHHAMKVNKTSVDMEATDVGIYSLILNVFILCCNGI